MATAHPLVMDQQSLLAQISEMIRTQVSSALVGLPAAPPISVGSASQSTKKGNVAPRKKITTTADTCLLPATGTDSRAGDQESSISHSSESSRGNEQELDVDENDGSSINDVILEESLDVDGEQEGEQDTQPQVTEAEQVGFFFSCMVGKSVMFFGADSSTTTASIGITKW